MGIDIRLGQPTGHNEGEENEYVVLREELHPSWSYGGFHRFRCAIAKAIGIDLEDMAGFAGAHITSKLSRADARPWSDIDDDIVPFLSHSDCDGEMDPDTCERVAPRLRVLLAHLTDDLTDDYDRQHGALLASFMDRAAEDRLWLLFR